MPMILATGEAEIRRIMVQGQSWQIVCKTLSQKKIHKKGLVIGQGIGTEFKPQYYKKKKRRRKRRNK
jgi:hypothetical protein